MKIDYIENPVIRTHRVKAFVKTLIDTGEFDKWAILVTSTTKTEKTFSRGVCIFSKLCLRSETKTMKKHEKSMNHHF